MIPSDHFVRFYNEIFKFLDAKGEKHLKNYWLEISRHQELHCLEKFRNNGLQGMYEFWTKAHQEENCDSEIKLHSDHIEIIMNNCQSLSKVLDNDASPCKKYCDHCAGWLGPLLRKADFYLVGDIIAPDIPRCHRFIFIDYDKALKNQELLNKSKKYIMTNLQNQ